MHREYTGRFTTVAFASDSGEAMTLARAALEKEWRVLAFITSLRHPRNSDDYGRVERLLEQTLTSVCNQTSPDFAVFVVGNREPSFRLPPRSTFVPVDFPPPVATQGPQFGREPFVWDKGTTIGVGFAAARAVHPDHVIILECG